MEKDACPQKITRKERRANMRLSTFIKNLPVKRFRKMLPRGTKDRKKLYYKPEALLKASLLRLLLDMTFRELETFLRVYKRYATACGFTDNYIPNYSYYCKFLTEVKEDHLEEIGFYFLRQLSNWLDIPCEVLAIDSSIFKARANSFTKKGDPDAETGKSGTKGWFFGYKLHIAVDTQTELPVAIIVTPGNVYDGHKLQPLLDKVTEKLSPDIKAVTADKGYDAGYNYLAIVEIHQAFPIIPKRGEDTSTAKRQVPLDEFLETATPTHPVTTTHRRATRERACRNHPPLSRNDPH